MRGRLPEDVYHNNWAGEKERDLAEETADVLGQSLILSLMCNVGRLFVDFQSFRVSTTCTN
jgi:hypothetical protein